MNHLSFPLLCEEELPLDIPFHQHMFRFQNASISRPPKILFVLAIRLFLLPLKNLPSDFSKGGMK